MKALKEFIRHVLIDRPRSRNLNSTRHKAFLPTDIAAPFTNVHVNGVQRGGHYSLVLSQTAVDLKLEDGRAPTDAFRCRSRQLLSSMRTP